MILHSFQHVFLTMKIHYDPCDSLSPLISIWKLFVPCFLRDGVYSWFSKWFKFPSFLSPILHLGLVCWSICTYLLIYNLSQIHWNLDFHLCSKRLVRKSRSERTYNFHFSFYIDLLFPCLQNLGYNNHNLSKINFF